MAFKVRRIGHGYISAMGSWDKAGRWYPDERFIVPGSFNVRAPSRTWGRSYYKHAHTIVYARALAKNKPHLYMEMVDIPEGSNEAKAVIAWAVEQRLKG